MRHGQDGLGRSRLELLFLHTDQRPDTNDRTEMGYTRLVFWVRYRKDANRCSQEEAEHDSASGKGKEKSVYDLAETVRT